MPGSQQPLLQTITVPEVQERSTVKPIYQYGRMAAASEHGEEATIVLRERRKCMQAIVGKHIYRSIRMPHAEVTNPNEIPTRVWRSQFNLENVEIHSSYRESSAESILGN